MASSIRALPDAPAGALDLVPNPAHLSTLELVSFLCLILILWTRSGQGDGYIAQRLFATRDERHSLLSAFWFSFAGTVLVTWPWIVVGLGSLIILPLSSAPPELLADPELAYPMMIVELMPVGLRGLMVATFLAAFMSTMDTHLCWGASYLVTDVYRRLIRGEATERHYVLASRIAVVALAFMAALVAWQMESIQRAWIYVIELTAGVAIVWLLRWYWWRVNAWAEVAAMAGSLLIANGMVLVRWGSSLGLVPGAWLGGLETFYGAAYDLIRAVFILISCTALWIGVLVVTPPDDPATLDRFYRKVRPGGWWGPVSMRNADVRADSTAAHRWLSWGTGMVFVYGSLLGAGSVLTGRPVVGAILLVLSLLGAAGALRLVREATRT